MLASPLLPASTFTSQHSPDDTHHYRPSRDIESFKSLLPPPIEFVEGSSSGAFAIADSKYEPINVAPKAPKDDNSGETKSPEIMTKIKPSLSPNRKNTTIHPDGIDISWPPSCNRGAGLYNGGNTCFLNSALQCLLHTPPLLQLLLAHNKNSCLVEKNFCMTCSLRQVAVQSHTSKSPFSPSPIANRLQTIAKHMRKGRQEDSHEFLRYAVDALQKSCIAGLPRKIDSKLAETTWVHKIFGGRLRSRVTCHDCGHNSDTFDRILDLSLDIFKSNTLKDALKKFVAIDYLKGADKYKCEKCKKHVIAEKRFSIHEAPIILTVHLKRFSPMGRKIGHHIAYDENLLLQHFMSEGQHGPSYSLYGVICHAGGGPNSGHYYAFVKSRDGKWWEMNDESVTQLSNPPTSKQTAYMLFYMRNKGQGLETALKILPHSPIQQKTTLAAAMKKRKERDGTYDTEDKGESVSAPFIGPILPTISPTGKTPSEKLIVPTPDPQAANIKTKIAFVSEKARRALASLDVYDSDSSKESDDEDAKHNRANVQQKEKGREGQSDVSSVDSSSKSSQHLSEIPETTFYGLGKRRYQDGDDGSAEHKSKVRQKLADVNRRVHHSGQPSHNLNPYARLTHYKRPKRRLI